MEMLGEKQEATSDIQNTIKGRVRNTSFTDGGPLQKVPFTVPIKQIHSFSEEDDLATTKACLLY